MLKKCNIFQDVIFIEENSAYKDHIIINVESGTLKSAKGYIIQELNTTILSTFPLSAKITGMYTKPNKSSINCTYYTAE